MKILLTGFEAFDQSSMNPSAKIVDLIGSDQQYHPDVTPLILPVDTKTAPFIILEAIKTLQPDIILCLGEAAHRPAISIERVAVNLLDFRIPDNNGVVIEDQPVYPDGPAAYFATLPVRKIYQNLRSAAIPVELSLSAGAYLCNQVLYTVLYTIAKNKTHQTAGFIHLPSLPQQVVEKDKLYPSMALETSYTAIQQTITLLAQSE